MVYIIPTKKKKPSLESDNGKADEAVVNIKYDNEEKVWIAVSDYLALESESYDELLKLIEGVTQDMINHKECPDFDSVKVVTENRQICIDNIFKTRIIYITRDSFCFADDAFAPNVKKYEWRDSDVYPEKYFFEILENYFTANLPAFAWRGFVNDTTKIADVIVKRGGLGLTNEIKLVADWRELLRDSGYVHFVHHETEDELPETSKMQYSFREVEDMYKKLCRKKEY
ncbi:MAG: DUF1902 domain-containing protein [Lachnospiraceae bacterium]|nr:DUF1902 domain-containing protein [Lachnospiraceae bacterium]